MGRIIGLIGGTCLLIAVLRLTNLQHEDQTLLGGVDVAEAQPKLSPREAYRKGKELYLRGRYDEALSLLESATSSTSGLTVVDRRQAEEYLSRTRLKLAQQATGETEARAQSPDEDPFAPASRGLAPDVSRARVDRLMALAQEALRRNDKATALKHAQAAHQLATTSKLKFAPKEVSPAMLLAQLQVKPAPVAVRSPAPATGGLPDWASESSAVTTAAAQDERSVIQQASNFETAAAPQGAKLPSVKEQAQALVEAARADIKAGRFDDARRRALQAQELELAGDVTFDLFEDRPRLVLNDIDRQTGTLTVAKNTPAPKAAPVGIDFDFNPGDVVPQGTASRTAPPPAAVDPQRQKVQHLLLLARADMKSGNFEAARAKAEEAKKYEIAYKLFDDHPDLVLSDVAAQMAAANIAQRAPAKNPLAAEPAAPATSNPFAVEPATPAAPKATPVPTTTAKATPKAAPTATPAAPDASQQAKQMLAQARHALEQGRFDEARQLAIEVGRLKVVYGVFDDRPDLLLAEIERIASRVPKPAFNTDAAIEQPAPPNAAAPAADSVASKTQAAELLKEARRLLKSGRVDEARQRAEAAEQLNVAYGVFDDRPDLVLAEIASSSTPSASSPTPGAAADSIQTANATFDAIPAPAHTLTPANAELPIVAEIAPTGLSALELYNQGMAELNRNNRAAAHRSFLQAHQTGQRLDPIRHQRMQNYLRELAPRNEKIQLASAQVTDRDLTIHGPRLGSDPAPLDAVTQQQSVKFDRLRTETLNAVFRAERLRAKDPEQALQIVEQAIASVDGAGLSDENASMLLKSLQRTRDSLQAEIVRQQPNLEQARHNKEVMHDVERIVEQKIFVEQEFAKLVEDFNALMEQRRFAEAEVVAKKAHELDPKNPAATVMVQKSLFSRRIQSNNELRSNKEESFWKQLDDVEQAAIVSVNDKHPIDFGDAKEWSDLKDRRLKYHANSRTRSEDEVRIQQSLEKRISLHEENAPLSEIIKKISTVAGINIVFDPNGLEEEGVTSHTPVTIDVDGIKVKSALNLMLDQHHLGYTIKDEALIITSRLRQQGDLKVISYPVADLVVPIPSAVTTATPYGNSLGIPTQGMIGAGQMSVPPGGSPFAQAAPDALGGFNVPGSDRLGGAGSTADFDTLVDLITTTISPDSWLEVGGTGSVRHYETTLSLVVRQTQKVHDEITDLLEQLRRLQDLQVTIEVRFVTVSDRFFERIGIDFDFNIQDTVGGPDIDNANIPLLPFGSVRVPQSGFAAAGQQAQAQQGQQAQAQAGGGFFTPDPVRELTNRDRYPHNGTIVGLSQPNTFTESLDIPFQQGSFEIGVPDFGGFNPNAGLQVGMAVLSDIEAFFFIQAAQGDERSNLMFAPKVTLFNGQFATVTDSLFRPFVISLIPTVGVFSTGFQPVVQNYQDGVTLTVQAVISADRRYVRLFVIPFFTNITDVFTFSFIGGAGAGGVGGGGALGQQGQGGGGLGGGGLGGLGGGGLGGGQFGIGGGMGATQMVMNSLFSQQQQQGQQGQGGQRGGQQGNLANVTVTVQQPVQEIVSVTTTVSVPDGGTVLLGGVKRLREGRNMAGVPILNKIPYVSRLFKNTGVGRETESLMLMVTPRIIIQEEEEELLGIPTE